VDDAPAVGVIERLRDGGAEAEYLGHRQQVIVEHVAGERFGIEVLIGDPATVVVLAVVQDLEDGLVTQGGAGLGLPPETAAQLFGSAVVELAPEVQRLEHDPAARAAVPREKGNAQLGVLQPGKSVVRPEFFSLSEGFRPLGRLHGGISSIATRPVQ
jgi:hypothetical protein